MLLKKYFYEYLKLDQTFAASIGEPCDKNIYTNYYSHYFIIEYKKLLIKYNKLSKNSNDLYDKNLFIISKNNLDLLNIRYYLFPLNCSNNIITLFKDLNEIYYKINSDNDYNFLISRIKCFPDIVETIIMRLNEGINNNLTISKFSCNKIISQLKGFLKHNLYIIDVPKKYYNNDYLNIINNNYKKPIIHILNFLDKTYFKYCQDGIGLCKLKNGKTIYKAFVKSQISLDLLPQQIYNIGLKEVNKIENELSKLMYKTTNIKKLKNYYTYMNNKDNIYKNSSLQYKDFIRKRSIINKKIINKYFHEKVENYNIKFVKKELENSSPAAYYYPVSKNEKSYFYLNRKLTKYKYDTFTLSIHEGVPGHHYQYRLMLNNNIPNYKIYSTQESGFSEGWALYTENLGNDYYTDLDNYGKLSYELLRAIRLIVDVGINYYNWSYKKAYKYMNNYTSLDSNNIKNELLRYIDDPGQALAYKIGELEIIRLRDKYLKNNIGTIKDFHKELLSKGVLTLKLYEYSLFK